jgi:hypothetical protein
MSIYAAWPGFIKPHSRPVLLATVEQMLKDLG